MITYYTCTQITPEVYDAYLKYKPSIAPFKFQEIQAVTLCVNYEGVIIFPVSHEVNARHLREFENTDPQSHKVDSNTLVSVEEFFSQLFILELEQ